MIPVVFKRTHTTVWVGATWARGMDQRQGTVVAILEHALQHVQAEKNTPEKAENETGEVQMDSNTFAIVGRDYAAVKAAIIKAS